MRPTNAVRLWGWSENEPEQERAKADAAAGKVPGMGDSRLSPEMQGVAFRNSVFSQLSLGTLALWLTRSGPAVVQLCEPQVPRADQVGVVVS